MEKTMKRYGVNHRFSTSYHPQTSGQVENMNRALKRIFEKTVEDNLAILSRKLDDALWAFRTAYKTPTEEVSSDDDEMVEVKLLMELAEENNAVSKEGAKMVNGEQIPSQKKRIMEVDQLTEDPSTSGLKDTVIVKSLTDDTKSQRNTTDSSVTATDSSATDYYSADESLVYSIPLPPLKNLDGVEPISGPKTLKSILRSKSTFKAEALKDVIMNELSLAPAKGNKISSASKVHSALAERKLNLRNPQHAFKKCEACGSLNHTKTDHYDIEWFKRGEALQAKKAEALKSTRAESSNANKSKTPTKRFICLERKLNLRNPQHAFKKCEACGSPNHTTTDHYDIEWFKRGEALQAKKAEALKSTRAESSNANKSKTPTKRPVTPRSINHEKYTLVIVDEYSRYTWVYFLKKKSQEPETIMSFIKRVENQNDIKVKQLRTDNGTKFKNRILVNFCDEKGISLNFSSFYIPEQNGVAKRKNKTLIEATRTMLSGFVFSKQYWTKVVATTCYTQNRSTIMKRYLKTPYEIFRKRIFLHVFGYPVYIHNDKDHLGNFDEKANDGYLLGNSLFSKAFRVFNTRRQQTKETYHITFDESTDAIRFSKSSVDNVNIAETKRYTPDEYLHPFVLESKVSLDQNGQADQNDQSILKDEILNDDHSKHSNHTNDEQIIDNVPNTKDVHISERLSSLSVEDTSVHNTTPILIPSLPIPSMVTPSPQDKWSKDKHIELVNIIDFLSEKEPRKVYKAQKHPGWIDAMHEEQNQFSKNKVWILVPAPYGGKTGGLDRISNKDATILYCFTNGVQVDYAKIIWDDLTHKLNKKTREKIVPYPSVHNLTLKPNRPKEPPFTNHDDVSSPSAWRLFKAWQLNIHKKNSLISSKPDRARIFTISGVICGTATISPVQTKPIPTTTTMFAATTPENMPLDYRASTSANPNPVISLAFMEANYETLESLLRDRHRQMRNNNLRIELEYFSEDYDELSLHHFKQHLSWSIEEGKEYPHREMNGQPLQSSLTSLYGGQSLSNNVGGNLPPNAHGLPFANSNEKPLYRGKLRQPPTRRARTIDLHKRPFPKPFRLSNTFRPLDRDYPLPEGLKMHSHIGSYDGKGDPDNFLHLFKGDIRMQKWLMPVACHMFTYTIRIKRLYDDIRVTDAQKQNSKKSKKRITEVPQLSDSTHDVADECVTTTSNDPLLGGEDRLKLTKLMELCTQLQSRVLTLETTKSNQALEIRRDMFDTSILDDEEVVAEKEISAADLVTTAGEEVTTVGVETSKPKEKGIVMQELTKRPTPTQIDSSQQSSKAKEKGKAKMIEPKKPLKRKDQIMIDEEVARNLEAQILRAEKIRSKPPTKTQKRNQMCVYLKNMANYKHNQLKNKSFKEIHMLFNNTIKWIESFVPMDTELVKGSEKAAEGSKKAAEGKSKRAGGKLEQEDAKRQRIEEENESVELKRCLEIILDDDDDVTIKATPLYSKSLTIVDYKIYKEGRKSFFKIIGADGNSQNYLTFGKMFKNFNREDLEVLWGIVKARFHKTKPVDDMDNLLFQTLETMFEHHVEDNI
nr:retrovirus-related Pol polyprotein from transposon TNT 1-94 [Tanacetum cinerariifolium]